MLVCNNSIYKSCKMCVFFGCDRSFLIKHVHLFIENSCTKLDSKLVQNHWSVVIGPCDLILHRVLYPSCILFFQVRVFSLREKVCWRSQSKLSKSSLLVVDPLTLNTSVVEEAEQNPKKSYVTNLVTNLKPK